jgi:asparagine synthase (glutamine-hydrolysing)
MCGLLTYVSARRHAETLRDGLAHALEMIHHRGPDETGLVGDEDIQFGFKRLSIIDVESSHQPMTYADGRYVMTFNGEIYNYLELRRELMETFGARFATDGDGEVILAGYHYWGEQVVSRLRGMFAFVLWDRQQRRAFVARDPFGIKPMYYLAGEDGVAFASEKKTLLPLMDLLGTPRGGDHVAMQHYFTLQYVPEPLSMHRAIRRLEVGCAMSYSPGSQPRSFRYFQPDFRPTPVDDAGKLHREIREALEESVAMHLRSDVPVGAFLSSGIDSTAIVALARQHKPDILTFTVGYDVEGFSEIDAAAKSAEYLGVRLIPSRVGPQEMIDALPRIVWHLDDPVADPSLVPLYFLARSASEHVTVVLSGEGADEFFGGYNIYREPLSLAPVSNLPDGLKKGLAAVSRAMPEGVKGKSFLQRASTPIEERYYGNARMFNEEEKRELLRRYDQRVSYTDVTRRIYEEAARLDDVTKMQYVDLFTWLRGDILVKADRMSMAHSLELRVPFLDTGVFEVARKLPVEHKITKDQSKPALRKSVADIVPPHILEKRKLGFPVPFKVWLRDVMYDWARQTIIESGTEELINKDVVLRLLEEHRAGDADRTRKLWTVLIFMLWHAIFVERRIDPTPPKAAARADRALRR